MTQPVDHEPNVVVLAGGVGGARFLGGLRTALDGRGSITAIVNVGDDAWLHGLRICPDLDTCMYTLGGAVDPERGWGHRGETWNAMQELAAYKAVPDWFNLGDRDIATHLIRTQMLRAGYPLSQVTEALCNRWQPGVRLLPVTDDRSETHVVVGSAEQPDDRRAIHFQEWWVRYRAELPTFGFANVGAEDAKPAPGVLEAFAAADAIIIAPSNPVVSVGALLAVPGIRAAIRTAKAKVVGVSPVIEGKALRGMAEQCLAAIGVESSAQAIAEHYGARTGTGILDGWLVAEADHAEVAGIEVAARPLLLNGTEAAAQVARDALELAGIAV